VEPLDDRGARGVGEAAVGEEMRMMTSSHDERRMVVTSSHDERR
jgi:hypothetical protein